MQVVRMDFSRGFRVLAGTEHSQAAAMTLAPGRSTGGPDNRHARSDQWLYVVSGEGRVIVDGEERALRGGAATLYPPSAHREPLWWFSGVPDLGRTRDGRTMVRVANHLYDAQGWLVGEPLSVQNLAKGPVPNGAVSASSRHLAALAEALARFHQSTARLSPDPEHAIPPLWERLLTLEAETEGSRETLLRAIRSGAAGKERETALRWLETLPLAIVAARETADGFYEGNDGNKVLCHGDLWPAHVRFDGGFFVGFVDFESMIFASPALDLAQLVSHFGGWCMREENQRASLVAERPSRMWQEKGPGRWRRFTANVRPRRRRHKGALTG